MTTAAVVYRSRTGTTRRYAEAIGEYLRSRGVEVTVASVGDANAAAVGRADLVLLGCWTSGLFVVRQHPDEPWLAFVRELPQLEGARVGLFTTYRLATGSMFRRMRDALASRVRTIGVELRSRDGGLSESDRRALQAFIEADGTKRT
ncbi:MAG TPA: flavodoxin family protein [Candidatus Dormibacteraeota bacterium]|nr:flavodoxin family protein [Candidatus Dormibacteraeota bacterium]